MCTGTLGYGPSHVAASPVGLGRHRTLDCIESRAGLLCATNGTALGAQWSCLRPPAGLLWVTSGMILADHCSCSSHLRLTPCTEARRATEDPTGLTRMPCRFLLFLLITSESLALRPSPPVTCLPSPPPPPWHSAGLGALPATHPSCTPQAAHIPHWAAPLLPLLPSPFLVLSSEMLTLAPPCPCAGFGFPM